MAYTYAIKTPFLTLKPQENYMYIPTAGASIIMRSLYTHQLKLFSEMWSFVRDTTSIYASLSFVLYHGFCRLIFLFLKSPVIIYFVQCLTLFSMTLSDISRGKSQPMVISGKAAFVYTNQ